MGARPARFLDPDIEILDELDDVARDGLWDRFEVFEALHHSLTICNPMTTGQLDEVIEAAGASEAGQVLDLACGSGEYLLRTARHGAIEGHAIEGYGIDLSPWMVSAAHRRAADSVASHPGSKLRWLLGDAKTYQPPVPPDIVVCIGAEWVWHDFRGTARALGTLVEPEGVVVIGAARLHHLAQADAVLETHGAIETIDDMAQTLTERGLTPLHRVDPTDEGWDSYLAQTREAAQQWQQRYPGERADQWVKDQSEWWSARQRDRGVIGWSVWIAQKTRPTE